MVKISPFLRLSDEFFGRFTANGQLHETFNNVTQVLPYLIRATVNNNCPKKKLTVFPNSKLISLFVNVLERASLPERNDFSLS